MKNFLRVVGLPSLLIYFFAAAFAPQIVSSADSNPVLITTGEPQLIFDWQHDACEVWDIPDLPARAFKDANGQVQLIAAHYIGRRMIGPNLNQLKHDCRVVLNSATDPDPSHFQDREWIASTYTNDGKNIYALLHDEYHGWEHAGQCHSKEPFDCWYNAITFAQSSDGGATYKHSSPAQLAAAVPYTYEPDAGPYGLFGPSNIIQKDGYDYVFFYSLKAYRAVPLRKIGLMRTQHPEDPSSWRAWDGKDFTVKFVNPYTEKMEDPAKHVFAPISTDELGDFASCSVTYNTYLKKYLLLGQAHALSPEKKTFVWGFAYSVSADLIHWSPRTLIMEVVQPNKFKPGDPDPLAYPSALDPKSPSRNFETTGQSFFIYCTRFNYNRPHKVNWTADRDLIRIPVRFK